MTRRSYRSRHLIGAGVTGFMGATLWCYAPEASSALTGWLMLWGAVWCGLLTIVGVFLGLCGRD